MEIRKATSNLLFSNNTGGRWSLKSSPQLSNELYFLIVLLWIVLVSPFVVQVGKLDVDFVDVS